MSGKLKSLCLFGAGGHGRVVAAQVLSIWPGPICIADQHVAVGEILAELKVKYNQLDQIRRDAITVSMATMSPAE